MAVVSDSFLVKMTLGIAADPEKGKKMIGKKNLSVLTFYFMETLLNSIVNCFWII